MSRIPCGSCDCGTYTMMASLNPKAREFGAIDESERPSHIPNCKKDNSHLCAGYVDFHDALVKLDEDYKEGKRY